MMRLAQIAGAVVLAAGAAVAGENPAPRMFPQELTFHLTFDDETVNPELGRVPITRVSKRPQGGFAFAPGLFGHGLAGGWASYRIGGEQPIADLSRPGSAVVWIRLAREAPEPRVDRLGRKLEQGASLLAFIGEKASYTLGKSPDDTDGNGTIWFHSLAKRASGQRVDRRCTPRFSFRDWTVGDWRMVALAWTSDSLCVSINGRPFAKTPAGLPLGELPINTLYVRGAADGKPNWWVIDECSIFNRKLSDEEVGKLYEATKKEAGI